MKDLEILNPITELKLGSETVTIREMPWPDAFTFLKMLGTKAGQFITQDGQLAISQEKLADMIIGGQELSEWLILKSTGKDAEWLKQRTFSEGLDLIEAALSMNVRPDFFAKVKAISSRLKAAMGKDSGNQSTSSSGKAIPVQT